MLTFSYRELWSKKRDKYQKYNGIQVSYLPINFDQQINLIFTNGFQNKQGSIQNIKGIHRSGDSYKKTSINEYYNMHLKRAQVAQQTHDINEFEYQYPSERTTK